MKPKLSVNMNGLDRHMKELSRPGSKATHDILEEMAKDKIFEIECENCNEKIKVPIGKSECPHCKTEVIFSLK